MEMSPPTTSTKSAWCSKFTGTAESLAGVGVRTAEEGRPRKAAMARALALSPGLTTKIRESLLVSVVALVGARVS